MCLVGSFRHLKTVLLPGESSPAVAIIGEGEEFEEAEFVFEGAERAECPAISRGPTEIEVPDEIRGVAAEMCATARDARKSCETCARDPENAEGGVRDEGDPPSGSHPRPC